MPRNLQNVVNYKSEFESAERLGSNFLFESPKGKVTSRQDTLSTLCEFLANVSGVLQ